MAPPIVSDTGMVATSHPEATRVGAEVLRARGNAVDAAIAANAALGVIEPMMCGIGGDLMAMVWDAGAGRLSGFNGAGRSPMNLNLRAFEERGLDHIPVRHPLTWTVPGCVEGWARLLERFGTRPLGELLQPAIRLAEEGCAVPPVIASMWFSDLLEPWEEARRTLLPGGKAPSAGGMFRNPDLARTLRALVEDWRVFYRGEIAERIGEFCAGHGGVLAAEDLEGHEGQWVEPISTDYRGHEIIELPPNTQGLSVLEILNMLEQEDLGSLGWGTAETTHRMIEAKKLAFEDRARHIADPEFADLPTRRLISKDHARERWSHFDPERALANVPPSPAEQSDTTYVAAVDGDGNAISLIQSIFRAWGSGAVPDGLGFCLQNRGLGFSLDPEHPSVVAPLKRPLHTIIPGFATRDGKPWLCFGVVGGPMQPQGQVQVLTNRIDFGMDVQAAGAAPRWRHEGSSDVDGHEMCDGGELFLEPGFSDAAIDGLRARGHRFSDAPQVFGGYQGIEFDHTRGVVLGGSDPRRDGCAMG